MAKNKQHHKHNPGIDPKLKLYLDYKMREENMKARQAGKEYGTLAMGIISLMATIAYSEVPKIQEFIIKASHVLEDVEYLKFSEIIDKVNEKMGTNITSDQIVEVDQTLARYLA